MHSKIYQYMKLATNCSSLDLIRPKKRLFAFSARHVSSVSQRSTDLSIPRASTVYRYPAPICIPAFFVGMCIYSLRLRLIIRLPSMMHPPALITTLYKDALSKDLVDILLSPLLSYSPQNRFNSIPSHHVFS